MARDRESSEDAASSREGKFSLSPAPQHHGTHPPPGCTASVNQPATQAIRREAVKELRVCLLPPWSYWCKPYSIAEIPPSWSPADLPRRLVPNHTSASGITATLMAFLQHDWADSQSSSSAPGRLSSGAPAHLLVS